MKQNNLLLVLSLTSMISLSGLSYNAHVSDKLKSKVNVITRKLGRLNSENKEESLNAVGEIALETLDKYVDSSNYSIERILEINDFEENKYVLVEFSPIGYLIYNVSNGDIVECAPTSYSPYLKTETKNLYYLPMVGYFSKVSGKYSDLMEKREVKEIELSSYKSESKRYHNKSLTKIDEKNVQRTLIGSKKSVRRTRKNATVTNHFFGTMIYADTEVPYSWYFKKNYMDFAYLDTDEGCCGYVATALLLSYLEIFISTGYFSPAQSTQYIRTYNGSQFYVGVPEVTDNFLYALSSNPNPASQYELKTAINNFMSGKNKNYQIKETVGAFTNIEKPINDGFPAIYAGRMPDFNDGTGDHAVVVYGLYDNTDVLCHFGWNGYTQVVMSRLGLFEAGGVTSIYNKSAHAHNTYFILNNLTYCGCGEYITC